MPSSRKIAVGAFLIAGVLLFTVGLFWIGDRRQLFYKSIELQTEFAALSGLKSGSKVLVAGMDAGEVLYITVPSGPEAKFRVRFRVLEKFRPILRTDSVATIQMDGLVGNKVMQVGTGTTEGKEVREGDTIPSREPLEIGDVFQEAADTVRRAQVAVEEIKGGVQDAFTALSDVNKAATGLMSDVGTEVEKITRTGNKIAEDVGEVMEGVKNGRGVVGKLLTDDHLYDRLRGTMREFEQAAQDLKQTSADIKEVASDFKSADIAGNVTKTTENLRDITEKGKEVVAGLLPSRTGETSLSASLRGTMNNAEEAMSDFAENMEALKRSWFFRGYFRDRGFFDLDAVSLEDYQTGKFAPDRLRRRHWVHQQELFAPGPDGAEVISEEGKKKLDLAMADFLRHARNSPVMVEGYASAGTPDEQFLESRSRAFLVRSYIVSKFHLRPDYVGIMPMGAVKPEADQKYWDGVSLVLFAPATKKSGAK